MKTLGILLCTLCVFLCGCTAQHNLSSESNGKENKVQSIEDRVELITNTLPCQQKDAESIVESLKMQNIDNLNEADALEASEGFKLQIKDELDNIYILHIDKKYHLYAIQEDSTQGKYIYMEVE